MAADVPERLERRRLWDILKTQMTIICPALLLLIAGFFIAYQFIEPAPPKRIVMATGSEAGAYHAYGKSYVEKFRKEGIELVLRPTAGSIENLALLENGEVPVAFVQGGIGTPEEHPTLNSLGSIYYEPIWVFTRGDEQPGRLSSLKGKRIAVGRRGSGVLPLAMTLLIESGVTADTAELKEIGDAEAAQALKEGAIDAAFYVGAATSSLIRDLIGEPDIQLMNFDQADAHARRHNFLSKIVLPQGMIDLAENLPADDIVGLAPAAMIVVSPDLHPALTDLFLWTMNEVHRQGSFFETPGAFPSATHITYPLSKAAERYYTSGEPFLQRYLPFWAANLVNRLNILLLPLLTILYPLFKAFPPLYNWRMRSRVNHWYKDLHAIDDKLRIGATTREEALQKLERLEQAVEQVSVPVGFADSAYALRLHIEFLRRKVTGKVATAPEKSAG